MKIRALKQLNRNDGHVVYAGQTITVSDEEGRRLCGEGSAQPVGEMPVHARETRAARRKAV